MSRFEQWAKRTAVKAGVSVFDETSKRLKITERQRIAAHYLELHGFMFCAHFGTDNCIDMATALFLETLEP